MNSNEFYIEQELKVGNTYEVTFDGTTYECTAYELQGSICIGNATLANKVGGNNEPFFIASIVEG